MIIKILIGIGFVGSVISMSQFSKYCKLLSSKRWALDQKTVEVYQARAQRWLAAPGGLIATAVIALLLGTIFS